jgi:hypothetical protein
MNDRDRDDLPAGIEEVGEAYRAAGFDDLPPPRIDEAVLAAAGQQSRRRAQAYWPAFAAAATFMLALGLVLNLTVPDPASDQPLGESTPSFAPLREEPAPSAQQDAAPETSSLSAESTASPSEPGPARSSAGLESANTDTSIQRALPLEAPDTGDMSACSAAQRAEAALWIECVSTLIERGELPRARDELADFRRNFPDRPLPENLTEALFP